MAEATPDMQVFHRKRHRDLWRVLPVLLAVVLAGALMLRQNSLTAPPSERLDSPRDLGSGVRK